MTKPPLTQSQKRTQESVGALFVEGASLKKCLFLKSSSDIGVIRNGGRNGARFAPKAFLATFKKFAQDHQTSQVSFDEFEVASVDEETQDFHRAQELEALRIQEILQRYSQARIIHLGGGHDHVYPLLKACSKGFKKVVVLNIDAHADTRTDENFHSGTPFRQFAQEFQGDFHLFQLGLNSFANSFSTLSPLTKGNMHILWRKDFTQKNLDLFFDKLSATIDDRTLVIFSLDTDALSGFEVPGVSAVNPAGLGRNDLLEIWKRFKSLGYKHPTIMGIYELNPLYDSLSGLSMRTIGSFLCETFE